MLNPHEPREIAFSRVTTSALEILVQEMKEILLEYHQPETDPPLDLSQPVPRIAHRISLLGQRLIELIEQYQLADNLRRQYERKSIPF